MLLIRRLLVRVSRRDHHPLDAELHHVVEEPPHPLGIGAVEDGGVRRDPEAALQGHSNGLYGYVVAALAADGEVVLRARPVHVDAEAEVLAGLERIQLALQQERIRTEVHEPPALDELARDPGDLRMEERFSAADADHGRAALFGSADAVL